MRTIMKIIQLLGSVLLWHGLCPLHQEAENREFWNANRHCTTTEDTPERKVAHLAQWKKGFPTSVIYHHASRALSYGTRALCNKKIKQKETKGALLAGWLFLLLSTENLSYQMNGRRFYLYMLLFFLGILLDSLLSSASTGNKEKCSNIFQIN